MIQISTSKIVLFKSMWSCCRQEYQTATEINLLFLSFMLQFSVSMPGCKVQLAPPTENVYGKHNGSANSEIGCRLSFDLLFSMTIVSNSSWITPLLKLIHPVPFWNVSVQFCLFQFWKLKIIHRSCLRLYCTNCGSFTQLPDVEILSEGAASVLFHKISTPGNQVKLPYFTQCIVIYRNVHFP